MLRYLHDTIEYVIRYAQGDGVRLVGYNDADWVGNTMDLKNTSGWYFNMGSKVVSWYKRKQKSMALSSTGAEYIETSMVHVRPYDFRSCE